MLALCNHGEEYRCEDCGGCYICQHKAEEKSNGWFWRCHGKWKRVQGPGLPRGPHAST